MGRVTYYAYIHAHKPSKRRGKHVAKEKKEPRKEAEPHKTPCSPLENSRATEE